MLDLSSAIKRAEEMAGNYKLTGDKECGYAQLAVWLRELEWLRKYMPTKEESAALVGLLSQWMNGKLTKARPLSPMWSNISTKLKAYIEQP